MNLDARKQDVGPIDPPEPKLTENEVEAAVEERLIDLFNAGDDYRVVGYACHKYTSSEMFAAMLAWEQNGDEEPTERIIAHIRRDFVESAKNAPEWDHIRRMIEEGQ